MEWDKVYWKQFHNLLCDKSPRHRVMIFIMRKGSRGFPITYTVRELSERLSKKYIDENGKEHKVEYVSERTVQSTISYMIKNDMVRRKGQGVLYSNPRMVFCGKDILRQSAQITYDNLPCGKKKQEREEDIKDDFIFDEEENRFDSETGEQC